MTNEWMKLDQERTRSYTTGRFNRDEEMRMIANEYAGTEDWDRPCTTQGCGGTLQWRATVGAMVCIKRCGLMTRSNGTVITRPGPVAARMVSSEVVLFPTLREDKFSSDASQVRISGPTCGWCGLGVDDALGPLERRGDEMLHLGCAGAVEDSHGVRREKYK
jgi:hypothetical protein